MSRRNVRLDARMLTGHRLICGVGGTFSLSRRTAKALHLGDGLTEVAQATVAQRRLVRLGSLGTRTLCRLGLDLADRLLQRQTLAGDFGFLKRRLDTTELVDERHARAVIQGAPVLARVFVQAADGPGNQRVIVSHCALFAGA